MTIFPTKWRANEQLGGGWAPTSWGSTSHIEEFQSEESRIWDKRYVIPK